MCVCTFSSYNWLVISSPIILWSKINWCNRYRTSIDCLICVYALFVSAYVVCKVHIDYTNQSMHQLLKFPFKLNEKKMHNRKFLNCWSKCKLRLFELYNNGLANNKFSLIKKKIIRKFERPDLKTCENITWMRTKK